MLDIAAITGPIYLMMLIGYVLTKKGVFVKSDMQVFGRFILNLALPCLIFNALSQRRWGDIFHVAYLWAYAVGSLVALCLGYFYARRMKRLDGKSSAMYAMGMSCANSGFVGFPILHLLMPAVAGVALALNMLIENLLIIPLLLTLAEYEHGATRPWQALAQTLMRLAKNPIIVALLAALLVSAWEIKLPLPLTQTITMLAATSGALSLLVMGGSLVGLTLRGLGQQVTPLVLGKLLLHPLAVALVLAALPYLGAATHAAALAPDLKKAVILTAAMPMMGIYPTMAQRYGQGEVSAAAVLVGTMASFFTLSALLWMLG